MDRKLAALFSSSSALLSPEALEYLLGRPDPEGFSRAYLEAAAEPPMVVTVEDLGASATGQEAGIAGPGTDVAGPGTAATGPGTGPPGPGTGAPGDTPGPARAAGTAGEVAASGEGAGLAALSPLPQPSPAMSPQLVQVPDIPGNGWKFSVIRDITGESTAEGRLSDFSALFRDRFQRLRDILRRRQEGQRAVPIDRMARGQKDTTVIGMVREVSVTQKKGHKILVLEDETGETAVLLNRNRDDGLADSAVLEDEVLAVNGTVSPKGDMLWANELIRPELELSRKPSCCEEPVYAAFISDLHVGSKNFLGSQWDVLLDWFGGGVERFRDISRRIRYLIIAGDAVDGIGIYPRQEDDLVLPDLDAQYRELARIIEPIPRRIKIILQPGNHDAVRPAEPQPRLPDKYAKYFPPNVEFVGNPCLFEIEGVKVLSYHGSSLFDFITKIPGADLSRPVDVMKEMLIRRHMAPVYGDKTPLAPEHMDHMVIDQVPDIFVTGHIHSHGVGTYRGVLCINASTWQSQTEYQKMLNFKPEPGRLTLVNLADMGPKVINFVG